MNKPSANPTLRESLINAGVRNLHEFGYPTANSTNILTDTVFRPLFVSMLNDNKGVSTAYDVVIDELLAELA